MGGCYKLRRTNGLPEELIHLGEHAFFNTPFEGEIFIPKNVRSMGSGCFNGSSIQSVVFHPEANVEQFGGGIFGSCFALRLVVLPHRLRRIPQGFLWNCPLLVECEIPETVEIIEKNAFF